MPKHLLLTQRQQMSPQQGHLSLHCPGFWLNHCLVRCRHHKCQTSRLLSSHKPLATPLKPSLRVASHCILRLMLVLLMLWRSAAMHYPASELPFPQAQKPGRRLLLQPLLKRLRRLPLPLCSRLQLPLHLLQDPHPQHPPSAAAEPVAAAAASSQAPSDALGSKHEVITASINIPMSSYAVTPQQASVAATRTAATQPVPLSLDRACVNSSTDPQSAAVPLSAASLTAGIVSSEPPASTHPLHTLVDPGRAASAPLSKGVSAPGGGETKGAPLVLSASIASGTASQGSISATAPLPPATAAVPPSPAATTACHSCHPACHSCHLACHSCHPACHSCHPACHSCRPAYYGSHSFCLCCLSVRERPALSWAWYCCPGARAVVS